MIYDMQCRVCSEVTMDVVVPSFKSPLPCCPKCGSTQTKKTWIRMPMTKKKPVRPYDLLDKAIPEPPIVVGPYTQKKERR